jgi:hypothetical protein
VCVCARARACVCVDWLIYLYVGLCTGDMSRLDALTRAKLSKLLDPTANRSDWRELASRLKAALSVNVLGMHKSPTKALLDSYEVRQEKARNLIAV